VEGPGLLHPLTMAPSPLSVPGLWPLLSSAGYWLLLSLLVGGIANRLPPSWLLCPPLRPSRWAAPGIRRWKRWIPDAGAALPGGVAKASLVLRAPQSLERLALEARRAEWVHWLLWAGWLPTAFWLPPEAVLVNLLFATMANLPCLLLQRHTRCRVDVCQSRLETRLRAR
jgi:glycosyl-4,4'-diaponeurosporenoate acyltransferase